MRTRGHFETQLLYLFIVASEAIGDSSQRKEVVAQPGIRLAWCVCETDVEEIAYVAALVNYIPDGGIWIINGYRGKRGHLLTSDIGAAMEGKRYTDMLKSHIELTAVKGRDVSGDDLLHNEQ